MRPTYRVVLGVFLCALLLAAPLASAQALQQLHANPLLVVKINKPKEINTKVAALLQRLGLDKLDAKLQDPLNALLTEAGIKEGLDLNGEAAVGLYEDPQGGPEPHVLIVIPVSNYKAFLTNFADAKKDGELDTFKFKNSPEAAFAVNWGNYAVLAPEHSKALLAKKPAGVKVEALAGKQLDAHDVVLYVNARLLGDKALPEFKKARPNLLAELDNDLKRDLPNQKFAPVIKALANQAFNAVEETLMDAQAATIGISLTDKGINSTVVAEFTPDTYIGKLMARSKNTNAPLLAGLPADRQYFAFGGAIMDPELTTKLFDDLLGPAVKELAAVGDDAKTINNVVDAMKKMFASTTGSAMGYVKPTGAPGEQPIMQAVSVVKGDAAQIAASQKAVMIAYADFFKILPQTPGLTMGFENKEKVKTVDGVTLDQSTMTFKVDANDPQAAQVGEMFKLFYGKDGMQTLSGVVDNKTFIAVIGGNDALISSAIAAAKKGDGGLSQAAHIKAVDSQLPASRGLVFYIALDNIIGTGMDFAQQFGAPLPRIKLPPDLPPIGVAVGTEGSAIRIDTHLSNELLEKLVSAGMQAFMMMQRPGNRGGL